MTATNMCSNFGGEWDSPPLLVLIVLFCLIGERSEPSEMWKTSYCGACPYVVCIEYVHNPESRKCTEYFTDSNSLKKEKMMVTLKNPP